jgi:osmotically inducible protein OsmC
MQIKRKSTAVWNGTGKEGIGRLNSQSTVLNSAQYGFSSRFEDGIGANPEELIAAAHAGCFSMKLAFNLQAADFTAEEIKTECELILENGSVTHSNLNLQARIPGITKEKFLELVNDAKLNCPISKLLNCEISLDAHLS